MHFPVSNSPLLTGNDSCIEVTRYVAKTAASDYSNIPWINKSNHQCDELETLNKIVSTQNIIVENPIV